MLILQEEKSTEGSPIKEATEYISMIKPMAVLETSREGRKIDGVHIKEGGIGKYQKGQDVNNGRFVGFHG